MTPNFPPSRPGFRLVAPVAVLLALAGCGEREVLGPSRPAADPMPNGPDGFTPAAAVAPTNFWSPKAPMSVSRVLPAVGVINGVIYVAGGTNSGLTLASVEAYTPGTNTWAPKAALPTRVATDVMLQREFAAP